MYQEVKLVATRARKEKSLKLRKLGTMPMHMHTAPQIKPQSLHSIQSHVYMYVHCIHALFKTALTARFKPGVMSTACNVRCSCLLAYSDVTCRCLHGNSVS